MKQVHTSQQMSRDGGSGWIQQMKLGREQWKKQDLPGDMGPRNVWTFMDTMNWTPYAPFSCAWGCANIYSGHHLEKIKELTAEYGKSFIFTAASKWLQDAVQKDTEHFSVHPLEQETWMQSGRYILLVATKTPGTK